MRCKLHSLWRRHHWPPPEHPLRGEHTKRRFLFIRLAGLVVLLTILFLVLLGVSALIGLLLSGKTERTTVTIWLGSCGLALLIPLFGFWMARRAFRSFGEPLANIMAAADAVADGDLTVQVSEHYPGEFGQLARSFNRMTRELAQADQQRRHLTADVAHELRTPLHIIQGNLEGILDGVYQATPEHISATLEEMRQLERLAEDLQTLSLAEAGQLKLQLEPVNVAELLADVCTSFSGQAEAAGIDLSHETSGTSEPPGSPQPLTLEADRGRLEQVLSNLVANALRHTPSGGAITLQAGPTSKGARIEVSDTGEGIPPEDLPYIFDRFWRGDPARSHVGGAGSGLGLAIARQLVQAHGGKIDVESQPGKGTTFTIDIPQIKPDLK